MQFKVKHVIIGVSVAAVLAIAVAIAAAKFM